jgi:hypothetical protein
VPEELKPGTPEADPSTVEADKASDSDGKDKDGGEGKPERTDWKALALKQQSKMEEANRLAKENADLKEQLNRTQATDTRSGTLQSEAQAQLQSIQQDISTLQLAAQQYGPDTFEGAQARTTLRQLEKQQRDARELIADIRFSRISDSDLEKEARQEWQSGQYASPEAAIRAAKGTVYERKNKTLEEQQAEREAERKAKEAGEVSTSTRGVGVREAKEMLHVADYLEQLKKAQHKGDATEEARLKKLERTGKVYYG